MSAARRLGRVVRRTALVVLVVGVAAAFAPSLLAPYLSARLSDACGVPVRVRWVTWNPFAGRVVLHHLAVAPASGAPPLITVRTVAVDVAMRRLLGGDIVLARLAIEDPWVALRRTATGDFNVAALLRAAPPAAPSPGAPDARVSPASEAPARSLVVEALRIAGGSVEFRDETTTPVLDTSLHLEDVAADDIAFALSGRTNVQLHVASRLERRPLTLDLAYEAAGDDSRLTIALASTGVSLARTLLYVPLGWRRVSGTLDLTLSYVRQVAGGRLVSHTLAGRADARDVALAEPWASQATVRAARARLGRIAVDFVRRRTEIGDVDVDGFAAEVARDAEGLHVPFVATPTNATASAWTTVVRDVTLGDGTLLLRNVVPGAEAELHADVRAGRLRTAGDEMRLALQTTTSAGAIDLDAHFGAAPSLRFTLHDLALAELGARLRLPVRFATGTLAGTIDVDRLTESTPRFSGSLQLPGGRTVPPDRAWPQEMLAWQSLAVDVAEATLSPPRLHLRRVAAEWPYAMVHRTPATVFPATLLGGVPPAEERGAASPSASETATAPAAGPTLLVDEVALRHGRVEFWDTTLAPPYWTELADADLRATSLVSAPFAAATVTVAGAVDELSPLRADATLDARRWHVTATVDRLRLPPLSAYLEPVLHYAITAGLARIDSDATLEGAQFEASNEVVLSRFALARTGDDVLQRELGAPLSVALALMKDYRGDIRLALPVRGDLGAGRFEVKNVLATALTRSLVGALRAPVTLLGAVFHRDEEERFDLRPVPFAAGSAELGADGEARIAEVARLLGRHTELAVVLMAEPSPADAAVLAATDGTSPSPDRLAALAGARLRAVVDRLVGTHHLARVRIREQAWTPAPLERETVPGVDVQLRGT